MKQSSIRAPSRSRGAADPASNPMINSHRTTPSQRNLPIMQNPPPLALNASASSRTTTSKNPLTPLISTEFLKKSIFDRLEDGLLSGRVPRSINNLGLLPQSMAITDRVISIGDNDVLKLQPTRSKMLTLVKKKTAQSLERIKKSSIVFDDLGLRTDRDQEQELDPELEKEKEKEKEKQMAYTKLMMFIPKNLETLSVAHQNKPSFISFNDIAKSAKSTNPSMLEELVSKSATLKRSESKSRERGASRDSTEQLDIVKNILKFNKLQKLQFNEQMQEETERRLTPLKGVAKHRKTKNKLSVRVVPSRRLHEPMYDMEERNGESSVQTTSPDKTDGMVNTEPSQREMSVLKAMNVGMRASSPEDYAIFSMGTYNFKFFWYQVSKEKGLWKPDAREGHTLTTVGKLIILYGGLGNRLLDRIAVYDSETDVWVQPEVKGEAPRAGRHSHTACEYKGQVVFFGGEVKFNPTLGLRECMNDIYVYIPEKNEWRFVKAIGKIDPRRNHAATIYDKFMYVYGGIGAAGDYMKDVWAFNFKANQWTQLFPSNSKDGGIAYHTMCACFNEKKDREKYKVSEEGIYVFGGKDEDGKILNTLKILASSGKTFEWKYPAIKGPAPAARYNHVMLWYRPLQLLLIHGGRNEYLDSGTGVSMNDIRILHLESMTWSNSSALGYVPKIGRSNHSAALMRTSLLIFGGVTFCEYANPDLRQIEINQLTTRRLMKEFHGPVETTEASPLRMRRRVEILENEEEGESHKESKEPDFVSWQPLPLKQQFPIEENLHRFRKAIKQTVLLNIAKKLGK